MHEERVLLADGFCLELVLRSASDYRLTCRKGARVVVEYRSSATRPFTSVEKLRYDFEKDVENALREDR